MPDKKIPSEADNIERVSLYVPLGVTARAILYITTISDMSEIPERLCHGLTFFACYKYVERFHSDSGSSVIISVGSDGGQVRSFSRGVEIGVKFFDGSGGLMKGRKRSGCMYFGFMTYSSSALLFLKIVGQILGSPFHNKRYGSFSQP